MMILPLCFDLVADKSVALITITVLCLNLQPSQSEIVYVSPSLPCFVQSQLCFSLDQLVTDSTWIDSNIMLIFLSGIHRLESKSKFYISNISLLQLTSDSFFKESQSSIVCEKDTSVLIYNVSHVSVSGLNFLGCECSVHFVEQLSIENSTFRGENSSETALQLIVTNANIVTSSFLFNRIGTCALIHNSLFLAGGAINAVGLYEHESNITIAGSRFENNGAEVGGAINARNCKLTILNTSFINNHASAANASFKEMLCDAFTMQEKITLVTSFKSYTPSTISNSHGGDIALMNSDLEIDGCIFVNSSSGENGGAMVVVSTRDGYTVHINNSSFYNCYAKDIGGVLVVYINSFVIIIVDNCTISNSSAEYGGVAFLWNSNLTIKNSFLGNNTAVVGGVVHMHKGGFLKLSSCRLIANKADQGGVLSVQQAEVYIDGNNTLFAMNIAKALGGAIFSYQAVLTISGNCIFRDNQAIAGGAIDADESSQIYIHGEVTLTHNVANNSGGGLYLSHSTLRCYEGSILRVSDNRADYSGGGMHVTNSFVTIYHDRNSSVGSLVQFVNNVAHIGGGISLQTFAQLRIYKTGAVLFGKTRPVYFDSNSADIGEAIYVVDETYFDVCLNTYTNNKCFLQVLSSDLTLNNHYDLISIEFTRNRNNNNSLTGWPILIYGGLLDRCKLNVGSEFNMVTMHKIRNIDGVSFLKLVSNLNTTEDIASAPVRLCFCSLFNDQPDCSYALPQINVTKGERFNISLVAVDQVNHTVRNVIVYSSLGSPRSGLAYGQMAQKTGNACTSLNFTITSPHSHEELILYADGPCRNVSMSQSRVRVAFQPCTCPKVGFQSKHSESEALTCECICDSRLYPYITGDECNYQTGSLARKGNFWITYIDSTKASSSGYVVYPHCPLDYCISNIPVNLNKANGSDDSQCANNRSGTLCGACKPGLSLSLGSTRCIQCSSVWHKTFPAMLAIALVVGILIVMLILVFNLTVAVGTLNGLIFYANILGANGGRLLSSSSGKFPSLFISWLNLEVGFDVCFFEGMDTYSKTWLQLVFPLYVIFLVVMIIIVSDKSIKFSQLLAKRNPVATLATLILLSYTMFLRTTIAVLSFSKLNYPDGSTKWVWLHDGTVEYSKRKHVALFLVAVVILFVGVVYTSLIFFWPWLLHYQNMFIFRWARYQKLHHFMAPYHAPYNVSHRYWTGLLLFARVALYLVFALNIRSDPGVNLLAIAILTGSIMFLRARVGRIYQNNVTDWIEIICYSNAALFSAVYLYLLKAGNKQAITTAAYISGAIILVLFMIVIIHHMWKECCAKKRQKQNNRLEQELISEMNAKAVTDYPPTKCATVTPTFSVVEGPGHSGIQKAPAMNADSTKQAHAHESVKPIDIDLDDTASIDSDTPLLDIK